VQCNTSGILSNKVATASIRSSPFGPNTSSIKWPRATKIKNARKLQGNFKQPSKLFCTLLSKIPTKHEKWSLGIPRYRWEDTVFTCVGGY
jgi:hypothetical protein